MPCCIIGSALMLSVAWLVRTFKTKVLRQPPAAPERWRLAIDESDVDGPAGSTTE